MKGKRASRITGLILAIVSYIYVTKAYDFGRIDERTWFLSQEFEDDDGQKWRLAAKKG